MSAKLKSIGSKFDIRTFGRSGHVSRFGQIRPRFGRIRALFVMCWQIAFGALRGTFATSGLALVGAGWLVACASAEPQVESQLVFPIQQEHVHSSSLVECPNGDLLVVWFQGAGERSADNVRLNGSRLRRGQDDWDPVFLMADTPGVPDCNPVLFVDGRDRLWLFWIVVHTNRWERSILKYRRADDCASEGPPQWTWQDVILLKPEALTQSLRDGFHALKLDKGMWAEYAPRYSKLLVEASTDPIKAQIGWATRARPLQLADGRIVLPLYSDGFNAGLMAISDDAGETWHASKPIVGPGPIQPTLARRASGEIVAYCRDSGDAPHRILCSESNDNGETWSLARDTELPNPGSSIALLTLDDGRWLLVYNDTEEGRHRLAVSLSDDEGRTWPHTRYLERDEPGKGSFAYPTAIQTSDGRIHVSYSYDVEAGASIKYASFLPIWVRDVEQ